MACVTSGKLPPSLFLSPSSPTLDQHFSECGLWTLHQDLLRPYPCPRPAELRNRCGWSPHCLILVGVDDTLYFKK